jgi:nitroreductase
MPDILLEPYVEALDEFPITGTAADKLRAAVRFAVRAPSSHNSQPWRFVLADGALELRADRSRALPVVDPDDRELVISCGSALFHLGLALRHFGSTPHVERLPSVRDPDLLARVEVTGAWERTAEDEALFHAIPQRHTNRQPFEDRHLPEGLGQALEAAAQASGAWLHVFRTPEARSAIASLVAEADRIQMADKRFRRELAAWLRPNWTERRDGMPGFTLGLGDVMAAAGPLIVRTFDVGKGRAAHDEELAEGSPILALLGTSRDTPYHWLEAGEALSHVLLRAQVDGVSASYLNQPIEIVELRPRLQRIAGRPGYPQMLLRLGIGREVSGTPRRPVSEVLTS